MLPRVFIVSPVACATLAISSATPVGATLPIQKVFVDQYLAEHPDREFVDYVRTEAKCFTCHQGVKDRKNHNAFGSALEKRLDDANRKDAAKVLAAIRDVESHLMDMANPDGPTFAERIRASKLPGGDLADSQREPQNATTVSR